MIRQILKDLQFELTSFLLAPILFVSTALEGKSFYLEAQ
jgi:hypothetical protein